jgi:hypothetical protein
MWVPGFPCCVDSARAETLAWTASATSTLQRATSVGAERSLTELKSVYSESKRWQGLWPTWVADYEASVARVQAVVLDLRGRPAQAERYWREAINRLSVSQCQPKIDRPGGLYTGSRLGTVFLDRCDL